MWCNSQLLCSRELRVIKILMYAAGRGPDFLMIPNAQGRVETVPSNPYRGIQITLSVIVQSLWFGGWLKQVQVLTL